MLRTVLNNVATVVFETEIDDVIYWINMMNISQNVAG